MRGDRAGRGHGFNNSAREVVGLDRAAFTAGDGLVHGLIGPDGAGKTTLVTFPLGLAVAGGGLGGSLRVRSMTCQLPDGVAGGMDEPTDGEHR
jgi:ABC-type multidrug transport system ATPase subunit